MHINAFLVKQLKLSNQQIKLDIASGNVLIDGKIAFQKQAISAHHTINYKEQLIQIGTPLFYLAYNKPVGVESTLNLEITNNLVEATGILDYFFPIGRLDKASEGLMILTNDGALYKHITDFESAIEKKYEVEVDQEVDDDFILKLSEGIVIMGSSTMPCKVSRLSNHKFRITLIEGRNRQIRRMCYKLGSQVLRLKRISIGKFSLDDLPVGLYKTILISDVI
jgi:23S rRNA pseudouridine2604 synthase